MKNNLLLIILLIILAGTELSGVDLSTQTLIHESESFRFFAEDTRDYSELFDLMETKYDEFTGIFGHALARKVDIYIFRDQESFSYRVFGSNEPVQNATGLADHVSGRFFITSYYDDCKPRERLLQTPVHELVHLFFPSGFIFIREGVACYYADMLNPIPEEQIPRGFQDIIFYVNGPEETGKAYMASGWMMKFIIEELVAGDIDRVSA